jgi:hypothetical protein
VSDVYSVRELIGVLRFAASASEFGPSWQVVDRPGADGAEDLSDSELFDLLRFLGSFSRDGARWEFLDEKSKAAPWVVAGPDSPRRVFRERDEFGALVPPRPRRSAAESSSGLRKCRGASCQVATKNLDGYCGECRPTRASARVAG